MPRRRGCARPAARDASFVARFALGVRAQFPRCPPDREHEIAEHACLKYSGRVGRSAAAKALDSESIRLAVLAHVRHRETSYGALLMRGLERFEARGAVRDDVERVLERWRGRSQPD